MARLWHFLTDRRVLGMIGLAVLAAGLLISADTLHVGAIWAGVAALVLLAGWAVFWVTRYHYRKRAAALLAEAMVPASLDPAVPASDSEVAVLRKSMLQAITTIKTSKLGLTRGAGALYELPWYMIIGNPAAGKSSAIGHSGLHFPIAGSKAVQGVAGTRNCDWFFTTDGILLDTAGRYSTVHADRAEWFGFLALLRTHRRRAPINGILIAVSVAELMGENPKKSIDLAKNLRTRVQELTERLGVYAPVYVIFTKADLIAGFADFFHDTERIERDRVWGATMRYNRRSSNQDVLGFFDQHFDELHDGLKEMSLASMAGNRSTAMRAGVLTFPLEFASIKTPLRAFLATLFDENSYQFKPVFRGFYFTSALQEGRVENLSSKRVASRFELKLLEQQAGETEEQEQKQEQSGYFLLNLFRDVIFADKDLVARYTSASSARFKYGAFFAATIVFGCALGLWSWSYMGNRQLVANVQADLAKVVRLQDKRSDLQSRLAALEILQDRIEQLDKYRAGTPWMLGFGLYQGEQIERKLRDEYYGGVREVMLQPVGAALEALLGDMNANAGALDPPAQGAPVAAATRPGQPYQEASPGNVTDGYNALKTYLMLSDRSRAEASHLNDQMTRFWRGWLEANRGAMPREQMIRSAERLMRFYLAQLGDPAWPQLTPKLSLLDSARENLRKVVRGTPARDRVYADIKARAATRFAAVTVARIVGEQDQALMVGSYAVPGAFTRDAWEKFVSGAIRDAANKELQSTDWVLKTAVKDDLTLEGSPEQIQKSLTELYQAEYIQHWLRFVQGVTISELAGFEASVQAMNRLGDPQTSPLAKLLGALYRETAWDNPSAARQGMARLEQGLIARLKDSLWNRAPGEARSIAQLPAEPQARAEAGPMAPMGPIGREFAGVARLVALRDKQASLMSGYLETLSRLRGRLNQLKNQGDAGPGAKQFMQQTLEGSGSELSDALKFVDEQMLIGMSERQKLALRPILVRPLVQTFAVIVMPSEVELNKTWQAQVVTPFQASLAAKAPFAAGAAEASAAEIGQVFGPDGAIAKFVTTSMGPLVVRRGDVLAARTWADLGITLAPLAVASFPGWIAPLNANGVAGAAAPQTVFQLLPLESPGVAEFTVEIAGQQLRYRNSAPAWTNMVHPGPQGVHGARISAVTADGRSIELFNEPSEQGLKRMIDSAVRKRKENGVFELRWSSGAVTVALELKIVSTAQAGGAAPNPGFRGLRLPPNIVGRALVAPAGIALAAAGAGGAP